MWGPPRLSATPPGSRSRATASVTSAPTASARPPAPAMAATVAAAWSSRAAATTIAPRAASLVAIARPIPRDAPVTSATRPVRSNMEVGLDGRQIAGVAKADDRGLAMDLANQSAQDCARTHFNIRCDALGRKAAHHGVPAYWRRYLRD